MTKYSALVTQLFRVYHVAAALQPRRRSAPHRWQPGPAPAVGHLSSDSQAVYLEAHGIKIGHIGLLATISCYYVP